MIKRTINLALLCATLVINAGNRKNIILKVFPDTTVADLFTTNKNGHLGLNLPIAPEFTKRSLFSAIPEGMSSYKAFYKTPAGTLTTASMIRFIKQSDTLFDDATAKKTYQKSLNEYILAHKRWFKSKKSEDLVKLHEASNVVRKMLETLELSNPITRLCLQRILSTPKISLFDKALNAVALSKRSTIKAVFGKTEGTTKTIVKPNPSWRATSISIQALKILGVSCLLGIPATMFNDDFGSFVGWGSLVAMIFSCYSRWKTDYNLTAEPENGIKVRIAFDEGESYDNSGKFEF